MPADIRGRRVREICRSPHRSTQLEHDPEKWKPVFRKDHVQTKRFDCAQLRAGPEVKEGLRDTVADAVARGIFGSPFIVVDGEPFRGADRLHMVERWLESAW
jgi:2-hydroxychromene-2-carboxylate isomerase